MTWASWYEKTMILKGDCIEIIKALKPNSVDAIVTDPPYNLHFMGKEWDKDLLHEKWLTEAYRVLKPGGSMLVMGGTRTFHRLACAIEDSGFIIKDTLMWMYGSGFPKAQEASVLVDAKVLGISTKEVKEKRKAVGRYKPPQDCPKNKWTDKNALYHRNTKNSVNLKAQHTPKSMDITKPLTSEGKHWDGFKVGGIKPAYEPIVWAVKSPEGSYVDNVLRWGVGAVNVDECRVGVESDDNNKRKATGKMGGSDSCFGVGNKYRPETLIKGRFPANIILSHHPECVQAGVNKAKSDGNWTGKDLQKYEGWGMHHKDYDKKDSSINPNGLETVESWNCHPDCPVRILDEQSGNLQSGRLEPWHTDKGKIKNVFGKYEGRAIPQEGFGGGSGGASRFFYCAKASRSERNEGLDDLMMNGKRQEGKEDDFSATMGKGIGKREHNPDESRAWVKNNHPTVKPIKLFEWLIRLVTREGQIILDPFLGSGTTAIAAHNVGRKCVGIEKEEEYLEISKRRIAHWDKQPHQMELR